MGKSSYFSDSLYSDFTEVVLDKQRKVQEEAERTRSRLFNLSITNIDDPDSGLLQENLEDNIFTPFRLGQPLSSMDAFEAEKNGFYHPGKLPKHIQAYAEKYSINPTDVTIEMLNAEEVKQKTNFIQLLTEGQGAIVGDKVYRDPNVDIFNPVQEPDSLLTPIVKPEGATAPVELSPGNYKAFDPKVLVTTHGKDMLGRALVELVNPITGVNINRAMNTAENNAYYNSRFNVKGAINYAAKSDALKEVGPFAENNLEVTKNENGTFNIRRNPNDGSGKQYTPFYLSDLTEEEVLVWTRVAIENPEKGLAELYEHDALQSVDRFNNMVLDVTGKALQGVNYFASGTDLEDEYARKWFKDNVQPFGTDYESLRDNVPDFKAVANKYKKLAAKDSSQFTEDEKEFWNSEQGEILHTITSDITAYEDRKQSLKEFETSLQDTIYTTVREYEENDTFTATYKEYAYDKDGNALGIEDKAQGAIAGTLEMFANNPESIPSSFFENLPYMLAFAFGGWATKVTLISEKDDSLIKEWHAENPNMEMPLPVRDRILIDAVISVIAESLGDKWVLRGKLTALKGKIDKVLPTTNLLTRAGLNTSMKAAQIASSTGFEYASGTISSMAEQDALLQDVSEIDDATAALAGAQEAKAGMGGASIRIVGDVAFKANIQERLNQIQSRNEILADSSRSLTVKQQTRVIESRDKLIASFLKDSDKNLQEKVRAPYLKRAWDSLKSSKNPKDLVLSLISPGNRDKIRKVEYLEHVLNVTEIELVGLGDVFDKEKAEALGRNPTDIDTAVWLLSVLKKLPPSEVNRVLITNLKTGIGYANEVSKTDIHLANAISVPTEEGSLDIQSFETDSKEQAFAINRANAINQYRTDVAKVIDIFGKKIEANPDQEEVLRLRQTDQLYRLKAGLEDTLRDVNLTQEVAQKSRDKIVQIDGIDTTSVDYNPVVEIDNIFNALEQDTVEDVDGRIKVIFAHRSKIDLKRQAAELAEDKTLEATYIKQIELVDKKLITFLESNKSTPAAESKLTPDIQTELFSIGSVDDFNNFKEIREKIGNTELSESEQKMLDIKESISKSLIFDETDKTLVEVHEEFLNGKSNEYIGLNEYLRQAADKSESFIPTRFDAFVERHQVKAEKLQEAAKLVIEGKKETHAFVDKNDLTAPIQTAVEGTEKHKKLNTTQYFRIHPGSNALLDITAKEAKIAVEAKNAMQLIFARQGKQTRRNVATVVSEQLAKDIKKAIKKETKPKDKGDIDSLAKRGKKPVAPKVEVIKEVAVDAPQDLLGHNKDNFFKAVGKELTLLDLYERADSNRITIGTLNKSTELNKDNLPVLLKELGIEDAALINYLTESFVEFKAIWKAINPNVSEVNVKRKDGTVGINEQKALSWLYEKNEDGTATISDEVIFNIMISSLSWLNNNGRATSINRDEIIAGFVYGDQWHDITPEDRSNFHKGVPGYTLHGDLGRNIVVGLNIKLKKAPTPKKGETADITFDPTTQTKLEIALGTAGVHMLSLFTGGTQNKALQWKVHEPVYHRSNFNEDRIINLEKYKYKKIRLYRLNDKFIDILEEKQEIFKSNIDALNILTGVQSSYHGLYFTPVDKVQTTIANSFSPISDKQSKLQQKEQGVGWSVKKVEGNAMRITDAGTIRILMGARNIDEVHEINRKGIEASNKAIDENIEHIQEYFELTDAVQDLTNPLLITDSVLNDGNLVIFFEYKIGSTGRNYNMSANLNGMHSKIDRHIMAPVGNTSTVNSEEMRSLFKLAVAQAFGFDIDKFDVRPAIRFFETEIAGSVEIKTAVEILQRINAGEKVNRKSWNDALIAINNSDLGNKMHIIEGLSALSKYETTKSFETDVTLEIDGVTNGYILSKLQLLGSDQIVLKKDLGRGGITFKGEPTYEELLAEVDESGNKVFKDTYQTFGQYIFNMLNISSTNAWYREDAIKKGKKSVIAITRAQFNGLSNLHGHINIKEEITAFARELAKNPFMISNYGAGLGKILDNVAQDVVNAIYAELEEINLKYKDKETRKDAYTQLDKLAISIASILDENSTSLQKELRNSLNAGTILNDTKDTSRFFTNKRLAVFKDKVKSIYRPSFEVSLDTLLGPIVERRNILVKLNEVSSYMFIINYEDGVEALKLEKIAKKKKTGKGSTVVTADERRSVVLSLISTMYPQYKGPWHDEKSFIDVVKKSSSDPSVVKLAVNPESTKSKANQKGVKELSSFLESLGFEPPGVAIIINMIHNMDSVLIGEVSLTYNFLSIFDAGIFALKDAIGGAALYDTKLLEFARKYRMVDIVIADFNRVLQNYIDTSTGSKKEALAKLVARINKDSYDAKLAIKKGESYEFVLSELIQDAKKLQLEVREEAKLLDEDGIVSNQMYLQHNLTPDKGQLEMFFPVGGRKKPFSRLNKKELLEEAANRAIDTTNMRVVDLKEAIKRYDLGKKVYPRLVPPTLPDLNPITPVADYIAGMVHPDSEDAGDFRGMDIHGKRKKGDIAGFYSEDGQGIDRIVLSEISEDLSEFDLSLISDGLNNDYVDIDWIKEQVSIEMSGEFYHPDSVREMHFYDGEQQQYEQDLAQQEAELKVERKAEEKARAELTNFEQLELFNKDAEYQRTSRLETSQENKKLFEAIKQHLAQTYPEVSVKIVDRVIDMFGEEVLGKAVRDTVYYSDTAYMDTVAHEYAHIYINILESTTFVDTILTRIQKENDLDRIDAKEFLTTHLGEKYVEYEKTNTWFTKAKYKLIGKINQLGRWLNKLLGKELKLKQKTALLQWEIDELSKHFYFGINSKTVRFSPSKGFNKVSLEDTLKENPEASEVLIKLLDTYEGSALTGSVALAEQGNVYRRGKGELHDLDMHIPTAIFDNAKTLFEQVSKDAYLMWEFEVVDGKRIITYIVPPEGTRLANVQLHSRFIKFSRRVLNIITGKGWTMLGSRIKSLDVVDIKTGKVVGGYSATIARNDKGFGTHITSEEFTGKKIVIVDLLENFEKVESYSFESAVLGRTIPLVKAYRIFRAKNTMGQARNTPRDKDVIDFTLFKPDEKLGITKPDELESAIDQKIEVEKTQEKETEKDVSKEELYSLGVEKEAIRQEEADFANPNLFEVVEKLNKVFKERSDKDYINDESRDEHSAHLDNILGNLLIKNNTELKEFSIETYESRDEFSVGRVNPVTGTVILDLNKHTPISYSEQTDQEVYVHEVLHVVSEHVISNHPEIANKLRKLYKQAKRYVTVEDFLEKDSDGNVIFRRDEVAERAAAQRQFDYLFKTLDAGKIPHEFLAYGLTNKFLVRKLKTLKYHHFTLDAGKGKDNFLINLVDLLVDTWEFFKDILINQRMPRKSLYDETVQVMRVINAINARKRPGYKKRLIDIAWRSHFKGADFLIKNSIQAIFKLVMWKTQKRDMKELVKSMLKRANLPLELIKDSALRKSVEAATERYYIEIRDNLIKVKNVPKNSKRYKDLRGKQRELTISFREELMTLAQSIGVEILGTTPIQLLDAILQVKFDKDHGRRSEKEEYTVNLMSEFKSLAVIDKLLSENVTIAFFRTDFVSLRENGYDDLDAIEFLVDEEALDIEIAKLEKILDISNNEFYRQKLIGLVDLMVIGDTTVVNAYRNAHNIFNLNYIEKNKNVPSGTKEEASLDVLATLMAIKRTDASVRKSVYELSKAEFAADVNENGILNLLGNLEAFKKDTLKELFNGVKVHVVKGYVGLITDPNRSLLVAPLSEEAKLKSEGFILIVNESGNSALPPITGMPTKFFATHRKVGLYVSSLDPTLANTEGVFSTTSVSHSKGTSVKQILFDENPEFAFQVYKLLEDYTKLQNKQEVYNLKNKSTGTAKSPVPILNHNLEVTDYAINLRHEYSREHLNQNLNFIAVFAQMRSHLLDKKVSKELSKKNIAVLVSDSRKYQVGDTDYVNILDPKYAPSTFERLPDYTKREILKRATRTLKGTNEFWVKKISINVFFGSTPPTASNLKGIRNLPLPKRTIKMIESVWQSTVRQAVVNIVIKIWAVLGGNVTSNAIYNLLRGMSPIFLVREQRNAIKEHDRWQKDAHRLNQIIIKAKAYPKLAAKLEIEAVRLTKGLRQNPVDKFMTSGLFVAYTEDVLENQFKYANRIENFFNRKFPRLLTSLKGSKANTFIQASFITEKSYLYKPLLQALQLSDFVARYALYKHLIENEGVSHADAWEEVVRAFIAYDVPLNPYVKYANDMGFILFVRYWLRIQSVGLRLAKNEPSALAFALVMQDMADIDPADIYESHILLGNILPPEGGIDKILSEVAIPPGWELGAELIP